MMDHLWIDVRQAFRRILRRRGASFLAIVILAGGVGATTALFSALHAVAIRPLDFRESSHLFLLWERAADGSTSPTGFETIADVRERATRLDAVSAIGFWKPVLTGLGDPARLDGLKVSGNFFSLLGVHPQAGRLLTMDDDRTGADRVVVVSYGFWSRNFGRDRSAIGRTIHLSDTPYEIVGVLPESFESVFSTDYGPPAEVFRALRYEVGQNWACRTCRHLHGIVRVTSGVTRAAAMEELDTLFAAIRAEHPDQYSSVGFDLQPLLEKVAGSAKPVLTTLLGAVLLLLTLACVNLASLQLGALTGRMDEIAIRASVGASRARIIRQQLIEAFALSLVGGGLGIAVAMAGTRYLGSLTTTPIPRIDQAGPGSVVLLFALAATIGTAFVVGIGPALRASRSIATIGGARTLGDRTGQRSQSLLIGIEVALAVALLIGAGLLVRSLGHLLAVDPGFDPDNLVTAEVAAAGNRYENLQQEVDFFDRVLDRMRELPGVESAAAATQLPFGGNVDRFGIRAQDRPLENPEDAPSADRYSVSPGWIATMKIPLTRGRDLATTDTAESEPVALIDEALAAYYWPGEDPIGRRIQMGADDSPWRRVVGVVGNVHHEKLDASPRMQFYVPHAQWMWPEGGMVVAIRAKGDARAIAREIPTIVHDIDPDQPVSNVTTMESLIGRSVERQRFVSRLLTTFGAVALALVGIGIFGVLTLVVGQRSREMAVRMALGARPSHIGAVVVRVGLIPVVGGIIAGIALSALFGSLLRSMLFETGTGNPSTILAAAGIVFAAAAASCIWPIRRAVSIEPAGELRA